MPSRGASRSSPPLDYEEGEISEESDDDESEEIARMLLADSRTRKKTRLEEEEVVVEEGEPAGVQPPLPLYKHDNASVQWAQELREGPPYPGMATASEPPVSAYTALSPMQLVQSPVTAESDASHSLLPSPPRSPPVQLTDHSFRFNPTTGK